MNNVSAAIAACEWGASKFFIFSANVFDPLIYYSHFAALVLSLGLGLLVFLRNRKLLASRLLFILTVLLSVWVFGDLVTWATEFSSRTMPFWSIINLVEPFVYAFSLYFVYSFVSGKDLSFKQKLIVFLPLVITIIFTPTRYALVGYDLSNCDRDAVEGPLAYYGYMLEVIYTLGIIGIGIFYIRVQKTRSQRLQVFFLSSATVLFLLSFAFGNVIGSFFSDSTFLGDYSWTIGQYGLFGVPVFVALLAYIIVRFKAFNIGLLAAQALILGLIAVLGLEFAFVRTRTNEILVAVTLVLTGILGIMLIRSVRREIQQRERIELLAKDLESANKQQVALIHFITHQLKGFVSKSRNIFAMISEGDYGAVPEPMKPLIDEGFASSTKGAQTIQEILNAANIKSGKVAYAMAPFDLSALIAAIVANLKPNADSKGVALTLAAPAAPVMFTGDQMQLENALKNLIDNTIKYTQQGSITLTLEEDAQRIRFTTKDTGVGITAEDMQHLFTEGGHGAESTKVNVDSTGFGLYIVKNIIEGHKGTVRAESEGAGKGSTFIVELPKG